MIEVFKTNIRLRKDATYLQKALTKEFPEYIINFDLTDKDKILRVVGNDIEVNSVMRIISLQGFSIEVLE